MNELAQAEFEHLGVGRLDIAHETTALASLLGTLETARAHAVTALHVADSLLLLVADRAGQPNTKSRL